jgi:hypothetical protein
MSSNSQSTKVIVTFPDKIQVDLVSSNELKLYERFQWLVALLLPIAVGFFTAYFSETQKNGALLWSGIVFVAISGLFIFFAIGHRKQMFNGKISREKSLSDFN